MKKSREQAKLVSDKTTRDVLVTLWLPRVGHRMSRADRMNAESTHGFNGGRNANKQEII